MNETKALSNIVNSFMLITVSLIGYGELQNLRLPGVELRSERAVCVCNPKYCRFTTCNVKFISRTRADINLIATTKRNLTVVTYHMKTYYKFSNNEYRPAMLDVNANFCDAESGLIHGSIMQTFLRTIWGNSTNFFQPCPLLCGEYYVKNFNFATRHLPSIFPAGRYMLNTTAHVEFNEFFFSTLVYFHVTNYGILDLDMG